MRAVAVQEVQNLARFAPPGVHTVQELDFAGPHPVKIVTQRFEHPNPYWAVLALVKGPQAVFMGEARGTGELPEGVGEGLVDLVRSVRFGEEQP